MSGFIGRTQHLGTFGHGDREVFFVQFSFEPAGMDAVAGSEEERLSWGSFEWWVGGRNLCSHRVGIEEGRAVHWNLLGLMEWFAANWDYLFHEQRPPIRNASATGWESLQETHSPWALAGHGAWDFAAAVANEEWRARHCLVTAREGGLFPDIVLRRHGNEVEISWGDDVPAGAPEGFRFTESQGAVRLAPALVAEPLHAVLCSAAVALGRSLPNSRRLGRLIKDLHGLANRGRQERRVAVLAGLGSSAKRWTARWTSLQNRLSREFKGDPKTVIRWFGDPGEAGLFVAGSCMGAVMFGCASPTLTEADVLCLARKLIEHSGTTRDPDKLQPHVSHKPSRTEGRRPFIEGYSLATQWSEQSGLNQQGGPAVDMDQHLADWGVAVQEVRLSDEQVGGVAVARDGLAPLIVLNMSNPRNQFPSGRRFSLAHELCHLLHDRRAGVDLALVSGPWAPIEVEKRANAFAAMLLMPDHLVERALAMAGTKPTRVKFDGLVAAAHQLGVSTDALAHHLDNRGWITSEAREGLLMHLSNR